MLERRTGFSLIEVVIALGVIAFAIVAILGLFPVAMRNSRDSRDETHATMIAQFIIGQIQSQLTATNLLNTRMPVGPDPTDTSESVNRRLKNAPIYAAYDASGNAIARVSLAQFDNPSSIPSATKAKCAYLVALSLAANTPSPSVSQITIDITYPGVAPAAGRQTNSFVAVLKNE